ncbi:MAG: hypothetical protein J0H60_09730 [Rhizobiales bacterium]|nr:hypothetical protein [Hyphomicrobiales bacterium]
MADPVLYISPVVFSIVERALAAHSKALEGISALQDYDTYCNTRRSADSALELAVVQIGAAIRDKGSETAVRIAGIRSTSTMGLSGALSNWLTAARKKLAVFQDNCPGHVASCGDAKICGRCGMHIDELRP